MHIFLYTGYRYLVLGTGNTALHSALHCTFPVLFWYLVETARTEASAYNLNHYTNTTTIPHQRDIICSYPLAPQTTNHHNVEPTN